MRRLGLFFTLIFLFIACATPYGIYYRVKPGENLKKISVRYKIDVDKLREVNNISETEDVNPGDYVFLPGVKAPIEESVSLKKEKKALPKPRREVSSGSKTRKPAGRSSKVSKRARFIWPVNGTVTSPFGPRNGVMHEGIDIAVPVGTPVKAAADGKVLFAGIQGGYGKVIIIKHADDFITVYAHNSKLLVKEAQKVKQGDVIALSGKSGNARGPHLHFEVRKHVRPVDPLKYLPRPRSSAG